MIEPRKCLRCGEVVDVMWNNNPGDGGPPYIQNVDGRCLLSPTPDSPYHDVDPGDYSLMSSPEEGQ